MCCSKFLNNPTCASDHRCTGYCTISEGSNPVPSYFQHFSEPNTFEASKLYMGCCPIIERAGRTNCITSNAAMAPGSVADKGVSSTS